MGEEKIEAGEVAQRKHALIEQGGNYLSAATEINVGEQASAYFTGNAESAEIAEQLGRALKLDALEQRGLANKREGERRGGDQKSDQSEAVDHKALTDAERQQRATARLIAD